MSQDITADCLNMIMNAKKAGKKELELERTSEFLIKVLEIAKKKGYLDYNKDKKKIKIKILELNKCQVIKPRFNVNVKEIEKYLRRYLPARGFGIVIISTSKGLMTNNEAIEKNIGGSLVAYFY